MSFKNMDAKSFRQNLANAVRQSSLNSSRMSELLDKFERGLPFGTPDDIDFLVDEVVKRIEERLLIRLAQLPGLGQNDEDDAKDQQLPGRPRLSVCDSALRHQARLLVDRVLRTVIRSNPGIKQGTFESKQPVVTGSGAPTSAKCLPPARDNYSKISPGVVKQYNYQILGKRVEPKVAKDDRLEGCRAATPQMTPTQPQRGYLRFAYGDGESARTETTYALRKAAKSSLRRYSITGNVKALMCAGEWARDDDVRVIAVPPNEATTSRPLDGFELLLRSDDQDYRQIPCDDIPEKRQLAMTTSRKESPDTKVVFCKGSPKTKAISQFLNSSYTYARRSEIKKALPKFMMSRCRNAMMSVFDAIRIAMADEDVENLEYGDMIAALIDRSSAKEPSSKAARSKSVPTENKPVRRQPGVEPYKTSVDYSTKAIPYTAEGAIKDRSATWQQNIGTAGSYKLRQTTRSCLSHMVQKGSSLDALLLMSRHMKEGQTDEEFWNNVITMDLDEKTRKEMISDLVEIGRQVRAQADSQKLPEKQQQQPRQIDAYKEEKPARAEPLSTDSIRPSTGEKVIDRLGNPGLRYDTNYKYGISRGLRRFMPKFTGNRRYSALMHYADSLMTDAYKELARTVDLMSAINTNDISQDLESKQHAQKMTTHEKTSRAKPVSECAPIGKVVVKTNGDEILHDAYSWVAQPSSDMYQTYKTQNKLVDTTDRVHYANIIDDSAQMTYNGDDFAGVEYKPVKTMDDVKYDSVMDRSAPLIVDQPESDLAEMEYTPLEDRDDVKYDSVVDRSAPVTDDRIDLAETEYTPIEATEGVKYDDADGSRRSVRFSDGIVPGEVSNDEEGQASLFFKKLGYYERVGSGEILHMEAQRSKSKLEGAKDQPVSQQDSNVRQVDTQDEHPRQEAAKQHGEKPATLCNCL